MAGQSGLGSSCMPFPANYDRSNIRLYARAKSPQDSAHDFFSSPATTWTNGSGSRSIGRLGDSHPLRWSDVLIPMRGCDVKDLPYWQRTGNAIQHNRMQDSVLVLVDGVRRGVFPVSARVPFQEFHLDTAVDHEYDVTRGGHWAMVLYGPEAANGVIDITSDQKIAQLRVAALRIRDSLGLWSYETRNPMTQLQNMTSSSSGSFGTQIEFKGSALPTIRWIDFFTDPIERARLRDSILVLTNGTRLGVFSINDRVPARQFHLANGEFAGFRQTTAPWAARVYGADAAHGVINIVAESDTTQPGRSFLQARQ